MTKTSTDYELDIFPGNSTTQRSSHRRQGGNFWFTQEVVASALDVDKTALIHIRNNHPGEFDEGDHYNVHRLEGQAAPRVLGRRLPRESAT